MKTHGRWQPRSSWQFNFAALLKKKKKKSSIQVHKGRRESKDSFLLPTCRLPALLFTHFKKIAWLGGLHCFLWKALLVFLGCTPKPLEIIWPRSSQSPSTFWWLYLFSVSASPALLQTETKPVNSFFRPRLEWGWGCSGGGSLIVTRTVFSKWTSEE